MATSSIVGGSRLPEDTSGKDLHALGPSDNSDSGSDAVGAYGDDELSSDSDAVGTGERASVGAGADIDLEDPSGEDLDNLEGVSDMADDSDDLETGKGADDAEEAP